MAGIYFHIPFCKQACHYCDFHFSTSQKHKGRILAAMHAEIKTRAQELQAEPIETIYFGGGTPSLLTAQEINAFLESLNQLVDLSTVQEITLEANPDDLSNAKLIELKQTRINRLSIGIQSFFEEDLRWMNRAHNATQAMQCLEYARELGFDNITIDLIYGSPTTTNAMWQQNLEIFYSLHIPHLSAYCLTVEEGTALHHQINMGKTYAPTDQKAIEQFELLLNFCEKHGVEQYEVSNFARQGKYAKHNSNYWFGKPYIGIGPSAHSFDGDKTRRFNIAHNLKYATAIESGQPFFETEELSTTNKMNEYILTKLRTKWGIASNEFLTKFGEKNWIELQAKLNSLIQSNHVKEANGQFTLTRKGLFLADQLTADLFFE